MGLFTELGTGLSGISSGITGIANVFGIGRKRAKKDNKELAAYESELGEQQAVRDYARTNEFYDKTFKKENVQAEKMFNKENVYNSAGAKVDRLKQAGLNPGLAISGQAAGTSGTAKVQSGSSNVPQSSRPHVSPIDSQLYGGLAMKAFDTLNNAVSTLADVNLKDAQEGKTEEEGKAQWMENLLTDAVFRESMSKGNVSGRVIRRKDGRYGSVLFAEDNPKVRQAFNDALNGTIDIDLKQSTIKANEALATLNNDRALILWQDLVIAQANSRADIAEKKARELSQLFKIGEHRNEYFWYSEGMKAAQTVIGAVGISKLGGSVKSTTNKPKGKRTMPGDYTIGDAYRDK